MRNILDAKEGAICNIVGEDLEEGEAENEDREEDGEDDAGEQDSDK